MQTRKLTSLAWMLPLAVLMWLSMVAAALADGMEQDKEFFRKAAISGMFEVQAAELATSKSSDGRVRDFAETMIADHSKANEELKSLAADKGVELPTSLDAEHQDKLMLLRERAEGERFTETYTEMMEDAHDDAVANLRTSSSWASFEASSNSATETLATLRQHESMADELDEDLTGL